MKKRIAINGFGRIGRLAFRAMWDLSEFEIVAINNPSNIKTAAHLLEYDSTHGKWMEDKIKLEDKFLVVNNKKVIVCQERDATKLPWNKLNIDIVIESSGVFRTLEKASLHLEAGAKKVIISAPGDDKMKTIVYNVNHKILDGKEKVFSCASCTTNCLAPVVKILHTKFGLSKGYMTTVHAYTNDQKILDASHKDLRRARAGAMNIIPTKTGATSATERVIPELKGRLDGLAMRVPVSAGSVVDLVCKLEKQVSVEEINKAFQEGANSSFNYSEKPLVSSDIIGSCYGSILDSKLTKIIEKDGEQLVKVFAWYDNEMSYVWQLVRTVQYFSKIMN